MWAHFVSCQALSKLMLLAVDYIKSEWTNHIFYGVLEHHMLYYGAGGLPWSLSGKKKKKKKKSTCQCRRHEFDPFFWEDLQEKEMAYHPNILAWKMPWTEGPGRLQSMGSHRELDMTKQQQPHGTRNSEDTITIYPFHDSSETNTTQSFFILNCDLFILYEFNEIICPIYNMCFKK